MLCACSQVFLILFLFYLIYFNCNFYSLSLSLSLSVSLALSVCLSLSLSRMHVRTHLRTAAHAHCSCVANCTPHTSLSRTPHRAYVAFASPLIHRPQRPITCPQARMRCTGATMSVVCTGATMSVSVLLVLVFLTAR